MSSAATSSAPGNKKSEMLVRVGWRALEQLGFETRSAVLEAASRILARVPWRRIISIFLHFTKAYDCMLRRVIMKLVEKN